MLQRFIIITHSFRPFLVLLRPPLYAAFSNYSCVVGMVDSLSIIEWQLFVSGCELVVFHYTLFFTRCLPPSLRRRRVNHARYWWLLPQIDREGDGHIQSAVYCAISYKTTNTTNTLSDLTTSNSYSRISGVAIHRKYMAAHVIVCFE